MMVTLSIIIGDIIQWSMAQKTGEERNFKIGPTWVQILVCRFSLSALEHVLSLPAEKKNGNYNVRL